MPSATTIKLNRHSGNPCRNDGIYINPPLQKGAGGDFANTGNPPLQKGGRGDFLGLLIQTCLILLALLFFIPPAIAQTPVSGAITSNAHWTVADGPYLVSGDVSIQNGSVLNIDPGTTIYMGAKSSLTIQAGSIQAIGAAANTIQVLSDKTRQGLTAAPGDWKQWVFGPGTVNTRLDYVEFAYGSGLTVQGSANYLNLHDHKGPAITVDLAASPTGIGNQAANNTLNGISVPAGDMLGNVTWGILGIPYVVSTGILSVGQSPIISTITPQQIQQSQTIDAVISGARLTGAEGITFDAAGVTGTLNGGGSDSSIPVRITTSTNQPLGNVPFSVMTAAGLVRYDTGINVIALKPTLTANSLTPTSLRQAQTLNFQISGSNLLGAQVSIPSGVGLTLANLQTTATLASFDLTASATATLGPQTLSVSNPAVANGVATLAVNVAVILPTINIDALPLIVPPDGVARSYSISLSNADSVDNTLNLNTLDTTIISVSPATVTIPAGSTSTTINLTGLKLGVTPLNITSPSLAAVSKAIYAANLVNGDVVGPVLSPAVGVNVPYSLSGLPNGTVVPVTSAAVGVNVPYSLVGLPTGTVVPVTSAAVGVNVPYSPVGLPTGTVVPVTSAAVGVNVPYSLSGLPNGTVVPVTSAAVGVNVPYSLVGLPTGTIVPIASAAVGVNVPYSLAGLPNGSVVPVTSAAVGVDVP